LRTPLVWLALLVPATAWAQPAPPPEPAPAIPAEAPPGSAATDERAPWEQLLDEGRRLFTDDADYAQALEHFQRSYQLSPNWQALNGIALVYQQQGLHVDAFDAYQRLLADWGDVLSAEQRSRVERRVEWLRTRIGTLELRAPQAGARILIDGRQVGVGPLHGPTRVMPGSHAILATLPGHEPMTRTVSVDAGGAAVIDIELAPSQVRLERAHVVRRMRPWIPWATLGAGAVTVGAGVLFHLDAGRDRDAVDDRLRRRWELDQKPGVPEDDPQFRRAQIKTGVAISFYVAGGAAAITGAVLAILNQPHMRYERARPQVVPTGNGVSLRVPF
jgi:hypothetical protein